MEGYRVLVARNGVEALSVLERDRPDVIVLDLMMPVMDGWEFRRRLHRHPASDTPVILLSADRDLPRKADAMHADGFLAKPFELDELVDQVRRFAPGS